MSILDCINLANSQEKKILDVLNSTCYECLKNPLMANNPMCSMEHRKNNCIITHDALIKAGLK